MSVEPGHSSVDPWYLENLICPVDRSRLRQEGRFLVAEGGRRYPIVEDMPVMLVEDAPATMGVARTSLDLAMAIASGEAEGEGPLYVSTLGVTDLEREAVLRLHALGGPYDAVVAIMIGATSGHAYDHLKGVVAPYPIPAFRFPTPRAGRLLDVGCNWGRWTIAAARAGHEAVGLDPQLGAVLAARRVAAQLGTPARFVVGDARFLPFRDGVFDYGWSYSVLQHFSREDARAALADLGRVLHAGGLARVQMANGLGARSLYHMSRRRFRRPEGFEVRYWTPGEMQQAFGRTLGRTELTADCYLGLGLQWSDFDQMNGVGKAALLVSEGLRKTSRALPPLAWLADSLFCTASVGEPPSQPSH